MAFLDAKAFGTQKKEKKTKKRKKKQKKLFFCIFENKFKVIKMELNHANYLYKEIIEKDIRFILARMLLKKLSAERDYLRSCIDFESELDCLLSEEKAVKSR